MSRLSPELWLPTSREPRAWCSDVGRGWLQRRGELTRLVRRRGSAARRAAERVDPIEVVMDDPHGERQRIVGQLEPPQVRHGLLRAIEFELRRSS
jgi:hypothetical protein